MQDQNPDIGVAAEPTSPIQQAPVPRTERVYFSGQAGEYFGIWFVNNIFTFLTLGIYSAWAKVRNLRYFYGNTEVAGGAFNFTASPLQILRSRVIAFALFVIFIIAENSQTDTGLYIYFGFIIAYLALAPILTVLVMSFQLRYSSWRGINFRFNKDYKYAYRVYLPPLAMGLLVLGALYLPFESEAVEEMFGMERYEWSSPSEEGQSAEAVAEVDCSQFEGLDASEVPETCQESFYMNPYLFIPAVWLSVLFLLALPYFDFINQRFLARNVALGTARFSYYAKVDEYYLIYWRWILATLLLGSLWALKLGSDVLSSNSWFLILGLASLLYFPLTKAYLTSKRYNLLLGRCDIDNGKFRLQANIPFLGYAWVLMTNTLAVMFSFGLMTAWAKVRSARILLENVSVEVNASLDHFTAEQEEKQNALGEEIADIFNVDLAI